MVQGGIQDHVNNKYNINNYVNQGLNNNNNNNGEPTCCDKYFFWLTVEYWSRYFDFDEDVIWARLKNALNPFNYSLYNQIHEKPDLYGPFWIMFTLAFC